MRVDFRYAAGLSCLTALYPVLAKLGLLFPDASSQGVFAWLSTGIGLAVVFLYGSRYSPGIFLGILWAASMQRLPTAMATGAATTSTLEVILAAFMLRRFRVDKQLGSVRDALLFIFLGTFFSSLVGVSLGVFWETAVGITPPRSPTWGSWWLSDATGALIVVAAILAWVHPKNRLTLSVKRFGEAAVLFGLVGAISSMVFLLPDLSHPARYPLAYLLSPLLLWAAFRFEMRGITLAICLLVVISLRGTTQGLGPFSGPDLEENLMLLWVFLSVITITKLVLTASLMERRRVTSEHMQLLQQVEQSQKMEVIGNLTGGIAHDFNNILVSIVGYTELAIEQLQSLHDHRVSRYLEEVNRAGQRARKLVAQLLSFSRRGDESVRCIDLAEQVDEALDMLHPAFPSTIQIFKEFADGEHCISADPVQVHQMVMNLCINARDAMGNRGRLTVGTRPVVMRGEACAACQARIEGEFLELYVKDSGAGIARDIADTIFQPFATTKPAGQGTGMGLAVVNAITHGRGGHILVESDEGRGALFRVLLEPRCKRKDDDQIRPAVPPKDMGRFRGRVLVVDDDLSVARFVKELLESKGCSVTIAVDALAALEIFRAGSRAIDLLIVDQTMPVMTGVEIAEKAHAIDPSVPIILCTGHHNILSTDEMRAIGIRAICHKPIDVHELFQALSGAAASMKRP